MTLHELCEAYRKGDRWVCFTGSRWATGKTECRARRNADVTMDDPLDAGNCWQLWREIAYRVTCEEPVSQVTEMQFDQRWTESQYNDLKECTIADFLLIACFVKKAIR